MRSVETLLTQLAEGLREEQSALAVVLVGSHARGVAHEISDIDLHALGEGPEYETRRIDGWLVTTSWRTPERVGSSLVTLPECVQAVPAWRTARILLDPEGTAQSLQRSARDWTWDRVPNPDRWCAPELSGYAEEVQKLRGAIASGDEVSAAIWRNVLAMRMAKILSVHCRLLVEREEETWPAVATAMGEDWHRTQRRALGLDRARFDDSCAAAIELYRIAVERLTTYMTTEERQVAWGALS